MAIREIVFDTETTGLSPDRRGPHRRDRLRRDVQPHPDRAELPRLHQSRARHAGGRVRGARPLERVPVRQAGLRRGGGRLPGLHRRRASWWRTTRPSTSASSTPRSRRLGHPPIDENRVVDTLLIWQGASYPFASNSLDALCQRYGIDNSRRTKHGALLDAEILAEVYMELLGGRQADLGLMRPGVRPRGVAQCRRRTQKPGPPGAAAVPAHRGRDRRPWHFRRDPREYCRLAGISGGDPNRGGRQGRNRLGQRRCPRQPLPCGPRDERTKKPALGPAFAFRLKPKAEADQAFATGSPAPCASTTRWR